MQRCFRIAQGKQGCRNNEDFKQNREAIDPMRAGYWNLGTFRQAYLGRGRLMHGRQDRVVLYQPALNDPGKDGKNNDKKTDSERGDTAAPRCLGADEAWPMR